MRGRYDITDGIVGGDISQARLRRHQFLEPFCGDSDCNYTATLTSNAGGRGAADAGACTRHNNGLAVEATKHHLRGPPAAAKGMYGASSSKVKTATPCWKCP